MMKKGIKFSLWILGISIGLAVMGCGLAFILKQCGLMFRAWVGIAFLIVMVLLGLALSGGIIYILAKAYSRPQEQKRKKVAQKVLSASGIAAVLLGAGVLVIFALFWGVFAYGPEHIIEKHGQKMVAYVNSFLEVDVYYYEYKNFLVCGYPRLGEEWYGNGGYDPFTWNSTPEPKTYKFYDTQGNLIAQSEEKQSTTPGEVDKEPEVSVFPPEKMQYKFSVSDAMAFSKISYSVDGENWEERDTGYHYQFFFDDISYLIFSYDWAMQHEAAAIYKSTDGSENWTFVSDTPSDKLLQNTMFFDENTGIFEYGTAGTDSYILYVTTDGAKTFGKLDLPIELQGQAEKIEDYISQNSQ